MYIQILLKSILLPAIVLLVCEQRCFSSEISHKTWITIITSEGEIPFLVEVAKTEEERRKGLMFRDQLDDHMGMLFFFPHDRVVEMWMKNTLIPLDIIFVNNAGVINHIEHNTIPLSLKKLSSQEPVIAVLEISGGNARALGIALGDIVIYQRKDVETLY